MAKNVLPVALSNDAHRPMQAGDTVAPGIIPVEVCPGVVNLLHTGADGLGVFADDLVASPQEAPGNQLTKVGGKLAVLPANTAGVSTDTGNLLRPGSDQKPFLSSSELLSDTDVNLILSVPSDGGKLLLTKQAVKDAVGGGGGGGTTALDIVDPADKILRVSSDGQMVSTVLTSSYDAVTGTWILRGKNGQVVAQETILSVESILLDAQVVTNPVGQPAGIYLQLTFRLSNGTQQTTYADLNAVHDVYTAGGGIAISSARVVSLKLAQNGGLKLNANGQLMLDQTNIIEPGGGLDVDQDGKIIVSPSAFVDNQTIVVQSGKLVVDPTTAPATKLKKISDALSLPRGGIAVDAQTGKLYVDFSTMPQDKIREVMQELKMQVPLEQNINLYVDAATGSDELITGRGRQDLPFKTISACVNYITKDYAIGPYTVNILIKEATYKEAIVLPEFTRTSGQIRLMAYSDAQPPTIQPPNSDPNATLITCRGAAYSLRRLKLQAQQRRAGNVDGLTGTFLLYISAGNVNIQGVEFYEAYTGAAPTTGATQLRGLYVTGGSICNINGIDGYGTSFTFAKGAANSLIVMGASNGTINLNGGSASAVTDIVCSGTATTFLDIQLNSTVATSSGPINRAAFTGTVTGQKYNIRTGSGCQAPVGGIPGDQAGVVDTSTYSWYKEIV